MIIPVEKDDLVKLIQAANIPEITNKYQISNKEREENGDITTNIIEFNLNNILIKLYDGNGKEIRHGSDEICRLNRFHVDFAGLSKEDNAKIGRCIQKVELPIFNYCSPDIATTKITFYNIDLK